RRRNLRPRRRLRGGGNAMGNVQSCCSHAVRRSVDCCWSISIYSLENDDSARLPLAIRLRHQLLGTRNQFPPRLPTRRGLFPLLRGANNNSRRDRNGGKTPATP